MDNGKSLGLLITTTAIAIVCAMFDDFLGGGTVLISLACLAALGSIIAFFVAVWDIATDIKQK